MAHPGVWVGGSHSNQMLYPSVDGNYQILKISLSKIGGGRLLCPPLDPPLIKIVWWATNQNIYDNFFIDNLGFPN